MDWYHGTTKEKLPVLLSQGLRKGSFVSPDVAVARHFANERARHNGQAPIILAGTGQTSKSRKDRSGRPEAQLTRFCNVFRVVES